jgi:hypothetical protein
MRRVLLPAVAVAAVLLDLRVGAQSAPTEVQSAGGLHTVLFRTDEGVVRVPVAADGAPGDTLSGVVVAEPTGNTPVAREQNLGELNGFVVDANGERQPVRGGRYRWVVPPALRSGRFVVTLRGRDGRVISRTEVPVDAVPAPMTGATATPQYELPTDGQAGQPAVIRGRFNGTLDGVSVSVGGADVPLLATSPRRVVFTTPGDRPGNVPLRLTNNGMVTEGMMRVIAVQLRTTNPQLLRGQTATMTGIVSGLQGLDSVVTLTLTNRSPTIVRLDGGDVQGVAVAPAIVGPDGQFTLTRMLTGITPGGYQITLLATRNPLSTFDIPAASERVLENWEAATRVRISPPVRTLIERSVAAASGPLTDFLRAQQANRADVRDVYAALLSHYCFDLRDAQTAPRAAGAVPEAGIRTVAFQAPVAAPSREITADDVERFSFSAFLASLVGRFSASTPVGYLFVSSTPANAGISIDGQRKSEMTNRRFVTSVGAHAIVITSPARTCQQRVQVSAFQTTVVPCE